MIIQPKKDNGLELKRGLVLGACVAAAVPLSPVFAAVEESAIEEIIVTAGRREENIVDVPVSMSLLKTEDFVNSGLNDINALADFVPNLTATDGGSPSLGGVVIRGLALGGTPTVGIYLNDVPFGPVIGGAGSSLALDAVQNDIERIEVVRGPQGTLYGASSMGGVIKYVTRKPAMEKTEGSVTVDLGNTEDGGLTRTYRGRVSTPLIEDKLAVSVSGFYEDADGYIDIISGEKDANSSEFYGGFVSLLFTPTEALSIKFDALKNESEFSEPGYVTFDLATGDPAFGDLVSDFSIGPRVNDFEAYAATVDYDFGWGTLTSVTSYQDMFFQTTSDVTGAFGPTVDFFTGSPPGTSVAIFNADFGTERFTQELRLTSQNSDKIEWIAGLYYTDQETDEVQEIVTTPVFDLLSLVGPVEYQEWAAFGNLTYYITPDWDVTVGVRYSDNETTLSQQRGGALLGGDSVLPINDFSDTVTTYLFNTRYRPSKDLSLYARAASGYRPAGANLVTLDPITGTLIGEPSYEADSMWAYEVGAKGNAFGGRVDYDVGLYYIEWDDAQISTTLSNGLGGNTNAGGGVTAQGIEISLRGNPVENLAITVALAYSDTELDETEPFLGALAGESLPGSADFTATLAADYYFKAFGSHAGFVGANIRHTGDYTMTYDGGMDSNGMLVAPTFPNFEADGYNVVDLRAGLEIQRFVVTLYVTNVANTDAYQTTFADAITPGTALATVVRPRTFGLNIQASF